MADLLYIPLGFIYLWLRYRNKGKVKKILEEEYENSYYYVGAELALKAFGIFLITLLSIFLIAIIGRIIYDLIKK